MSKLDLEAFLHTLRTAGWHVRISDRDALDLNPKVLGRYSVIPEPYLEFLRQVAECSNAAQNAWFLCVGDFNGDENDATTFRWNEWERIGLDAAEGDEELIGPIVQFWDTHLPIMSSVHSDYSYLAISLVPDEFGAIVYGYAPDFEDAETISDSFEDFLCEFQRIVSGDVSAEYVGTDGERYFRREFSDFL